MEMAEGKKAKTFSIKMTHVIYASPEKVFEALTDAGIIGAWGGGLSVLEREEGGKFELFDGWVKGKVLIYNPAKELSYTWKPDDWKKKDDYSTVTYKFKKHAAGTEIILEHSNFPSEEERDKHEAGWVDYVFDPMNDYFTQ